MAKRSAKKSATEKRNDDDIFEVAETRLDTPVEMHLMSELRDIIDGFNAVHAQRPMRAELSKKLYAIFRENVIPAQMSADETGHDEVTAFTFSGVPIVSGDYDGVRLVK